MKLVELKCPACNGTVKLDPEHPGERKARVVSPPGFRLMVIPPRLRWVLFLMALASLLLIGAQARLARSLLHAQPIV